MYAKVENNTVTKTLRKPNWIDAATGEPVSDAHFISEGIYPLTDVAPTYDEAIQNMQKNPVDQWEINIDHVAATYTITPKTQQEVDDYADMQLRQTAQLGILRTDVWTIPADSVTEATVLFGSEETVHFSVNGILFSVEPVDYIALLEVAATEPGPIQVQVKNQQLIITALEI